MRVSSQQLAADHFASRPGLLCRFLADVKKPERKTAFLECGGIEATMAALTMHHKKQQQSDDGDGSGDGGGGSNGSSDASAKLAENACGA